MMPALTPSTTALVLVDVQNDFFHADGALARSGKELVKARSFVESLIKLCNGCRDAGMLVVGSAFTLIADTRNEALVPQFIRDMGLKPLRGDFQVSKWGHQLIEEVQPVDYIVDKTGPSAFFRTELDLILRHRGISNVVVAGLNATRSVVATAYDAMALGLRPIIVSDCCGDYDAESQAALFAALHEVFPVVNSAGVLAPASAKTISAGV